MKKDFASIHQRALKAAENYLRSESDLIEILQQVDECKGYREITVSNARTIAPVLTPQNQEQWLHAAATLSKHKLEKAIAAENPKLAVPERVTYVSGQRLEFKIGISEELHQKIRRVQDLASTQLKRTASLEDTLKFLAEFYLEKADPVRKAERAKSRASRSGAEKAGKSKTSDSSKSPSESGDSIASRGQKCEVSNAADPKYRQNSSAPSKSDRTQPAPYTSERHIRAELEHQVTLRDQGQCTHHDVHGNRCTERRWLDIHHILPLSHGGRTTLENLTTLCRGHHRMTHALMESVPGQVALEFLWE